METPEPSRGFYVLGPLAGVILGLLLVGAVSHLVIRHIIPVTPAAIAAVFVARGGRDGRAARYAALPVFLIWLQIMAAIWLYLLGIATILTGHFSTAETVLTVVIGLSCVWGIGTVLRHPRAPALPAIIYFVVFAVLQLAGIWLSFRPAVARR